VVERKRTLEGLAGVTRADFAVVGAGVMGVTIAAELRRRHPRASIVLLEKEDEPGLHASGRNSGVLHAGFYYTPDSLKARFTRDGNRALRDYCAARNLRLLRCGKLVVAKDESELATLEELFLRAARNGVEVERVSEAEARRIEPRVKTAGTALWSPTTSTVDPREVMRSLAADAVASGVRLLTGARVLARTKPGLRTSAGEIACGFVVNAAGLHADRIAQDFGFSQDYRILPFKGLYLYSSEPAFAFKTNVYPVPNLRNPFLGVHVTVTVDGHAKLGPTAIPCLWREQYGWTGGFSPRELAEIAGLTWKLWWGEEFDFRGLASEEMKKYARRRLVEQAMPLADGIRTEDYVRWGTPGIRAQLVDVRRGTLVQDFVLEGDAGSLHVLNAVSPGWTCALPFANHVCDRIADLLNGAELAS
jgi:L-2-hydroxyglutarate oxidase LhgO